MEKINIEYLNLYRGIPFEISKGITLHIPTLGEICKYGEKKYYSMIHTLCSVGVDLCWQLEKINIPFDEISDYILFCKLLSKQYTNKDTSILFDENLDFSKMNLYLNKESNSYILIDDESETEDKLIINEEIYFKLITYLREIHHLKRNEKVAGSGSCRRAFIEDALMEYEAQKI